MTVLQEEQEKPQIETGPTRHAKIMRGIVTPIFGLLAIACVVFGVLNSTVWKPDNEITAAAPVNGSEYVVTDPNVLQLVDSRVNISAKSRDKKSNVCIAIGSARDVAGWIAGSKYMRVSGLSDWTTLSTMKVSAQGTADNSQNQVAFKDSDMWRGKQVHARLRSVRLDDAFHHEGLRAGNRGQFPEPGGFQGLRHVAHHQVQ